MRRIFPKKTAGIERDNHEDNTNQTTSKEADERRLRKLKGFLKSVSYNGSEGMQFETLNDLYRDSLLLDRPPCTDFLTLGEFKCNPTPFLVSSCFNKTQVDANTKGKHRGLRKTVRKTTPRKVLTPNKNGNSKLSEIYGKMECKGKHVKTPTKKQGMSSGKVRFGQGRRSALDVAVETAVQAGKSQTTLMKDVKDEKKEEKEEKSEDKSQKKEAGEKKEVEECTKEKDDNDTTIQKKKTKEENSENNEDEFKNENGITDKTKEEKQNQQESKKEQEQKSSETTRPSTSGKSGKKVDKESKFGKSAKELNNVAGKTSYAEAKINAVKTNGVSKTKSQDSVKSTKSNDERMTKSNSCDSHKEQKQHRHSKGDKSSSPVVASTSTENRTPSTRLRARTRANDDVTKTGRQLRLRRERPLTASPDKGKNKDPRHGYSIRKRIVKKTNTR